MLLRRDHEYRTTPSIHYHFRYQRQTHWFAGD